MNGRRLTLVCFGLRFMPPDKKNKNKKTVGFMSDNYWPDQIGVFAPKSGWPFSLLLEPLIYETALTFLIA